MSRTTGRLLLFLFVVMVVSVNVGDNPTARRIGLCVFLVALVMSCVIAYLCIMRCSDSSPHQALVPCPQCGALLRQAATRPKGASDSAMLGAGYVMFALLLPRFMLKPGELREWEESMAVHRGEDRGCPDCGWHP